jgi:hypothetical protein
MFPEALAAIGGLVGLLKGNNSQPASMTGLPPDLQAQLLKMLQLQTQRSSESAPIHQAAMAMASRLAPAYARGAMTGPSASPVSAQSFAASASPTLTGNSLNTSMGSGSYAPAAGGNPFTDPGIQFVNGNAYRVPGGSRAPVTGPEDPDPLHHPAMDGDTLRQVSDAMQRFFLGNPSNAFFGSGLSGSGEQTWNGGRGRAV